MPELNPAADEPSSPATSASEPRERSRLTDWFHRLAVWTSQKMGSPWAFMAAVVLIVGWALTGPIFGFGDTWQLVINTSTTIITFLMVFLIQSSQNRDARAIHLKLDELIRSSKARNVFADLEEATEEQLAVFEEEFRQLRSDGARPQAAAIEAHQRARHPKHKHRR